MTADSDFYDMAKIRQFYSGDGLPIEWESV